MIAAGLGGAILCATDFRDARNLGLVMPCLVALLMWGRTLLGASLSWGPGEP
jgi:hypothetical protein